MCHSTKPPSLFIRWWHVEKKLPFNRGSTHYSHIVHYRREGEKRLTDHIGELKKQLAARDQMIQRLQKDLKGKEQVNFPSAILQYVLCAFTSWLACFLCCLTEGLLVICLPPYVQCKSITSYIYLSNNDRFAF